MPSVRASSLAWLGVKYISVVPLLLHISGAVSVTQVNTTVSLRHALSADDVSVTVVK